MSDVYLIEVGGAAVGLVSRDGESAYRFHAAVAKMNQIDGRLFATPDLAQRAAKRIMDGRLTQTVMPSPSQAA